jgi:putative ABC transport system permease protein
MWRRMTSGWHRGARERELSAELESHLDLHVADNVRAGMSPEEARRRAVIVLGGVQQVKERYREAWGGRWLDEVRQDLRYAVRTLLKNPGFTATAAITLALGIGANVAALAVTYGVLLRPLPFPDSAQLLVVNRLFPDQRDLGFDPARVAQWLERFGVVGQSAAYKTRDVTVRVGSESWMISAAYVTRDFFRVLQVPTQYGRISDFGDKAGLVVSTRLADRLPRSERSEIIGRPIDVGERTYQIAAVVEPTAGFPDETVDAWLLVPTPLPPTGLQDLGYSRIVLRATPGMPVDEAKEKIRQLIGRDSTIAQLGEAATRDIRPVLQVSVAAGLLVLVVACANVATLFISRNVTRGRETATRLALGAGVSRLVRALFVEALLLAAIASAAGVLLAAGLLRWLLPHIAGVVPRLSAVELDGPLGLLIAFLTVGVAIGCAAFPAWNTAHSHVHPFLRTTTVSTPAAWRLRGLLVIAQIALSVVLLVGAGLLTRSVTYLLREDSGFTPKGALEAKIILSDRPLLDQDGRQAFVRGLLDRVRALPGVMHAGLGSALPPTPPLITMSMRFVDKDTGVDESRFMQVASVTPGYLRALGAQFVLGSDLGDGDAAGDVVVLSESAARFHFRGKDPIGGQLPSMPPLLGVRRPRVIGIVRDIKYEGLDAPPGSAVYVPWSGRPMGTGYLIVRYVGDITQMGTAIRTIARDLDRTVPIQDIRSMDEVMARSIANRRLRMFPAVGFAALAFSVALVGLLVTLARAVAERRQDLAIRAAVGASPSQLVRVILAKGLAITGLGVAVGVAAAWAVGRNLSHLLFRVTSSDPATYGSVALLVSTASIVAVYIAARRAAHADPLAALRHD